jgi:hypothetical protein
VIRPSPLEPNVVNRPVLEERLRALTGAPRRFRPAGRVLSEEIPMAVSLLLPDLAVRAVLLPFEQFPARKGEQEALIRWRLGQEQRLPLAGAKLCWQVFPPAVAEAAGQIVLVVAVQEDVLTQYESVCESVGLVPRHVAPVSLDLVNLWLAVAGGPKQLKRDLAWLTVLDGGFTCFIIHQGRPVFVRTKILPGQTGQSADTGGAGMVETVTEETAASLQACLEHHPGVDVAQVLLATDDRWPGLADALQDRLGVAVDCLGWEDVASLGWTREGGQMPVAALPAVAGLV